MSGDRGAAPFRFDGGGVRALPLVNLEDARWRKRSSNDIYTKDSIACGAMRKRREALGLQRGLQGNGGKGTVMLSGGY